jgi:hypothetical protein
MPGHGIKAEDRVSSLSFYVLNESYDYFAMEYKSALGKKMQTCPSASWDRK